MGDINQTHERSNDFLLVKEADFGSKISAEAGYKSLDITAAEIL